jgi:hypothetical protein
MLVIVGAVGSVGIAGGFGQGGGHGYAMTEYTVGVFRALKETTFSLL